MNIFIVLFLYPIINAKRCWATHSFHSSISKDKIYVHIYLWIHFITLHQNATSYAIYTKQHCERDTHQSHLHERVANNIRYFSAIKSVCRRRELFCATMYTTHTYAMDLLLLQNLFLKCVLLSIHSLAVCIYKQMFMMK